MIRVNGKITAFVIQVIEDNGSPLGIMTLAEAIVLAQLRGVDLVEIEPNDKPPLCRLVDFGKFRYEQEKAKRSRENPGEEPQNPRWQP